MIFLVAASASIAATPRERYKQTYSRVDKHNAGPYKDGLAGRNLASEGLASGKDASAQDYRDGIVVMRRMLHPAPVEVSTPEPPVTTTTTTATTGTGAYSIPSYIVSCESGGNYGAVNPDSGAMGAYQIMPDTWDNYGCGDPSSASDQDACAAEIYAAEGSEPWDCG